MPDDALIGQLEQRRTALVSANREILSAAQSANRGTTDEENTRYDANRTEIRALDQRLDDLTEQAKREQRGNAARADGTTTTADNGGSGARVQVTGEPMIYGKGSPHSYWADLARD